MAGKGSQPQHHRGPGRFIRLRSLRCYDEVLSKIKDGVPLLEVARFIQQDRHEYDDVTVGSLNTLLTDFRATIPKMEMLGKVPAITSRAIAKVREGLNELDELEKLYLLQMKRIEMDVELEKKVGKLFNTTFKEVRTAVEILKNRATLKMDLGLNERHIGTLDLDTPSQESQGRFGPAVAKVLADPESRRRVTNLALKLLSLNGKESDFDPEQVVQVEPEEVTEPLDPNETLELSEVG